MSLIVFQLALAYHIEACDMIYLVLGENENSPDKLRTWVWIVLPWAILCIKNLAESQRRYHQL